METTKQQREAAIVAYAGSISETQREVYGAWIERDDRACLHGVIASQWPAIAQAISAAAEQARREAVDTKTADAVAWLLTRVGSWTSARWDQHLRHEYGDERANDVIDALDALGVRPYIPPDVDRRLRSLRPRATRGEADVSEAPKCSQAIDLIAEERARQVAKLGYTPDHDDEHGDGAIAWAAACYAAPERIYVKDETSIGVRFRDPFPWSRDARMRKGNVVAPEKASPLNRIGLLVKAGALVAAEIDRLLRAAPESGGAG